MKNIFRKKLDQINEKRPSIYQEAIYDFIKDGSGNLGVEAVAGSGKTTTTVNCLKLLPKKSSSIFVAFNKGIVDELANRMPNTTRCSTIHGIGWQSMLRHYRKATLKPNKVIDMSYKVLGQNTKFNYILTINKVIDLMRVNMTFDDIGILLLMDKHNIPLPAERNFIEDCIKIFDKCIDNTKEFDFTDMVFIPALNDNLIIEQYDYVFIDECQDLNAAQQMVIHRLRGEDSRFVAVGDSRQAIYGFSGSDVESFNTLMSEPNTTRLPLSICYRCAKEIVLKAQLIVPYIEYNPNAPDGIVRQGSWSEVDDGDWVICRNVRPLVVMCMRLITQNKKAWIRGKDIGKSIINILKQIKQDNKKMCYYVFERIIEKQEDVLKEYGVKEPEKHSSVVELKETLALVKFLGASCRDVPQIIDKLESIFTDEEKAGIQMMTIHKSKGLEADRVFFLCPELIPSRFATQQWQIEQENNLMYVGYTRAKSELVMIDDFKMDSLIKTDE